MYTNQTCEVGVSTTCTCLGICCTSGGGAASISTATCAGFFTAHGTTQSGVGGGAGTLAGTTSTFGRAGAFAGNAVTFFGPADALAGSTIAFLGRVGVLASSAGAFSVSANALAVCEAPTYPGKCGACCVVASAGSDAKNGVATHARAAINPARNSLGAAAQCCGAAGAFSAIAADASNDMCAAATGRFGAYVSSAGLCGNRSDILFWAL